MPLTWNKMDILYKKGNLKKYITDDSNRNAIFIWASSKGHLKLVKYLVEECGTNVRASNDYAVRCACGEGHLEVVKYLIKRGADVRSDNDCAVQWASISGHLEMVKYLIEKCMADVRTDNDYAIRSASGGGHFEVVKYLAEKCGADTMRAIEWASENDQFEVVKYLINHGAVLSTPNPRYKKYLFVCEKGEEKRRERASKTIYFWWVQVCYDVKRPCGNRMMRRNYEEYTKIVF